MTGRGTSVTSPELSEPLTGLLQGLSQGSHEPHGQWERVPINSLQEHGTHCGKLEKNTLRLCKTYYGMFRARTKDRERTNWTGEEQVWRNIEERG